MRGGMCKKLLRDSRVDLLDSYAYSVRVSIVREGLESVAIRGIFLAVV